MENMRTEMMTEVKTETDASSVILKEKQTPIEIALDIDETGHTTARKLYAWLELDQTSYARWVRMNITENPYAEEGIEFSALMPKTSELGGRPTIDYLLSASFAKKLAMTSRSPKGEETRDYFIKVEAALVKAVNKPMTKSELALWSAQILVEQEQKIRELEERQMEQEDEIKEINAQLATHPVGWYTIAGYASKIGMSMDVKTAGALGMRARKLSNKYGKNIQKTPDPRFGVVNVYCPEVLEEVFSEYC